MTKKDLPGNAIKSKVTFILRAARFQINGFRHDQKAKMRTFSLRYFDVMLCRYVTGKA